MKIQTLVAAWLATTLLLGAAPAYAQATAAAGSLKTDWFEGAADCSAVVSAPQIEVHAFNETTYILRQSLCSTFEAPFMYLLIGEDKALLIDTGGVEALSSTPLADTVLPLLPQKDGSQMPLTIVHSHGHSDHKAGDAEFTAHPSVRVIGAQLDALEAGLGFTDWPNDSTRIELGGRTVHAVPTPGHHKTHVVYYDEATALAFTGDFLLPGRLIVEDTDTYLKSAERLVAFLNDKPVPHILGAHVELDQAGALYDFGSLHHPKERGLALGKDDLMALPARLKDFNGFYAPYPNYVITHPMHMLMVVAAGAGIVLMLVIWGIVRFIRKRRG
ncbi:MBL fold metallo-hydrolase [Kordiimonas sp.]|uniref:MBL fold metallo-hydrolase n=1 Tax=Kordiimonas sp. TaxID=1970157 RepID=UPI003A8D9A15